MKYTTTCHTCGGGTGMPHPCHCAANKRAAEDSIVQRAVGILKDRLIVPSENAATMTDFFSIEKLAVLSCAALRHEEFWCMFFNSKHRLIAMQKMATGTVQECAIHPREFARAALDHNASFVILVHNHPNGTEKPSPNDVDLTHHLQKVFGLLDVLVYEHLIVAGTRTFSMRNHDLLLQIPPT